MVPILLSSFTASSCIGLGNQATLTALREQRSGLAPNHFDIVDIPTYVGEVASVDDVQLPVELQHYDCRNNRLALLGLQQDQFIPAVEAAKARYGAARIGVLIGTSTSGILQTELAYRRRDPATGALPADFHYAATHNTFSVTGFVRDFFDLSGPAVSISSACSSSAKVFASAQRMLSAGLIDAALVGGVDTLCLTTLYGFNSLGLTSAEACRPYDTQRNGISIGEAAAFVLLTRATAEVAGNSKRRTVALLGIGESSDAYHMSSPHPDGLGAEIAMRQALQSANLSANEIDYINLHGTSTPSNDAAEGKAVMRLFGTQTPCSSTKGATGHTLGAAGGLEAVICALALQNGFKPGGTGTRELDPEIPVNYLLNNVALAPHYALSNSFGFGGTNCSLIFGLAHPTTAGA